MSDLSDELSPPQVPSEPWLGEPSTSTPTGPPIAPASGLSSSGASNGSTTDTATEQAKQVKDQAVDTTKQVAGVAAEQAQNVASEAKAQTRNIVGEARQQLTDQASTQQNNAASWLFSIVDELEQMVGRTRSSAGSSPSSAQPGAATALVEQASQRAHGVATWLQDHEPEDLLAETGRFARRRPALFLGIALAGGILAGRLTRGLTADSGADDTTAVGADGTTAVGGTDTTGVGAPAAAYEAALPPASASVEPVYTQDIMEPVDTVDVLGDVEPAEAYDPFQPGDRGYRDDAGRR